MSYEVHYQELMNDAEAGGVWRTVHEFVTSSLTYIITYIYYIQYPANIAVACQR